MRTLHSIYVYLDRVSPRISDEAARRFEVRFFCVFGFVVWWGSLAGLAWLSYVRVAEILDVPIAQLTLGKLLRAAYAPAFLTAASVSVLTNRKPSYEEYGRFWFWTAWVALSVWAVVRKRLR